MNSPSSRSVNSLRNTVVGVCNKLMTLMLSFISRTIFIKYLGPDYLGVNALYGNILMVLSLLDLGLGNVMVYSFYQPIFQENKHEICSLFHFYKKVYRVITISILILGIGVTPFLGQIVQSELPYSELVIYFLLFLINLVASYFNIYKIAFLNADQKAYIINSCNTLFIFIQNAAQILAILIYKNYILFLCIQVVCTLCNAVFIGRRADNRYPFIKEKVTSVQFNLRLMKDNIKSMFISKVGNVIMSNTDSILISIILGTVYAGYYSNYNLITININTFIYVIIQAFISSIGNMNAGNDMNKSHQIFYSMILFFHWISSFCTLSFLLVFQDFIFIWIGKAYLLSRYTLIAIAVNFYIQNIVNPVWMFRETMGLFKQIRMITIISAIINIILSVILGNLYGLPGIIYATAIARITTTVWYEPTILFKYKFHKGIKDYYFKQLKYMLITILAVFTAFLACHSLPVSLPYILVKVVVCFFIVTFFFLLFNYKNVDLIMLFHYILQLRNKNKTIRSDSVESVD